MRMRQPWNKMRKTCGRNPEIAPRIETMVETIVGICRGIIIPGLLRWCLRGFRPSTVCPAIDSL